MAAFANDEDRWDEDVALVYAENLRAEGEKILLVENLDISKLTALWPMPNIHGVSK